MIHRTGKRAKHESRKYSTSVKIEEPGQQDEDEEVHEHVEEKIAPAVKKPEINIGEIMEKRTQFIPLRLKLEERKFLRL